MAADKDTMRERNFRIEKADLVQQLNGRAALALHHRVKFEEINRGMNLNANSRFPCSFLRIFEELRRARIHVTGKQHRGQAVTACAVEFLGKVNGGLQAFASSLVVPVVFQAAFAIVKEAHVLIARPGSATDTDLIHHIDVAFWLSTRAADIKSSRHSALEDVNQ